MMNEKSKYLIALGMIPRIGIITAKNLIAYTGSPEAIFKQKRSMLRKIPGIGEGLAEIIFKSDVMKKAEEELAFIKKNDIKLTTYLDENYPERLKNCVDAPLVLFHKGNANLNCRKILSIVGTRNATREGVKNCNKLIDDLAENHHPVTIVSGLAYGVDITAHKASLKKNMPTIAVLAHGLHMIYPSIHRRYAREIIDNGMIISEFSSQTSVDRNNFIRRNRIIAGLADATVVVESGAKGGALITADIANSYNRDVFAFPGRVNDQYSLGCNKLIKTNKAALIENVKDIEYVMGWEKKCDKPVQKKIFNHFSPDEEEILSCLKEKEELTIDQIGMILNKPASKISPLMLNLEFSAAVKCLPGKVYCLA